MDVRIRNGKYCQSGLARNKINSTYAECVEISYVTTNIDNHTSI